MTKLMARIVWPKFGEARGRRFWLRPINLWKSRRKLRFDRSGEWRHSFGPSAIEYGDNRSARFSRLIGEEKLNSFRVVILGDTGEGDRSQYALVPLIKALNPDLMIINGDVAYPSGDLHQDDNKNDYVCGFFRPYRGFQCPIWAVPGNHEYYSRGNGREFFEIFCTETHSQLWAQYGMKLFPQPGTYWEIKEPQHSLPLVLIGIDTGMRGDLDGDARQMEWLEQRLASAQADCCKAVILFHIPALVGGEHKKDTALRRLHRLVARFPCVRLVVGAHEHNHQEYSPTTFGRYLQEVHSPADEIAINTPLYFVSGGGGAHLTLPDDGRDFPYVRAYPSVAQLSETLNFPSKLVSWVGLKKSPLAAAVSDRDEPRFLSFLLLEATRLDNGDRYKLTVAPVFLDRIEQLFPHLGQGDLILPGETMPDEEAARACVQPPVEF